MTFTSNAIAQRKKNSALALDKVIGDQDVVLVFSSDPIQKSGGHDQTYDFLPHPDYYWLTGSRRPHGISAYSKSEGWIDFVLLVGRDERIWEGGREEVHGRSIQEFDSWLTKKNPSKTYLLGLHQHSHLTKVSEEDRLIVQEAFNNVRRVKDHEEVALIRTLAEMASHGYKHIKNFIRPGVTERQIQIEYEFEVLKRGADKMPYGSIVGAGTNAAILHAVPTSRIVKSGDLVLIDAGADIADYCVDITRMFSADGSLSSRHRMIYDLVLKAQEESIKACRPGTQWRDIHLTSARVMAQGLKDLGIIKVSVEDALADGTIACFFPHGVGHMVGLRVRDVGGPFNPNPKKYAGARLRVDMEMKEGYLMTVEPGLYFIEALLDDSDIRSQYKDQINWTEVAKWKDFGGVRLEDNILFTNSDPVNLTACVEKQ